MPQLNPRLPRLDALRATWMLWMAAFHFCFDLAWFRVTTWNFYSDPLWIGQRVAILSGFLFWAGLALGVSRQREPAAFWRRWMQVAGAALLVSVGSWLAFPKSYISFGVLHAFAVLLPLAQFGLARLPSPALLLLAAAAVALPHAVQHPVFDSRLTNWAGLVTHKPVTEDYVPLLPWAAPLLVGLVAAQSTSLRGWLAGSAPAPLVRLGQWPLSFYLLHQPVLIGLLTLWQRTMAA
ncbi:MAG: DUF1624 domain-containing protein [Burkholderiales bacterium]|nr:DUF1624 domain-containing protein [Burkholderiales bacterium]